MSFEKVKRYIGKYDMLPDGSRVLCACSGGADSVALLHMLCALPGVTVLCAHFNHRLRGAESDRDEQFVKRLCTALGVPFFGGSADVAAYAAAHGQGIEEAARTLRYAFLEQTAAAHSCGKIATAHNADDNAETVLFNLLRGSGARGLSGIPPVRGNIVRPLLCLTRAEIEKYLALHGLEHVEDSTNASDACTRNRIRHGVLPLLREENSAAVENILSATELLREDEEYFLSEAEKFMEKYSDGNSLPVSALLTLPKSVMMRVFRKLCGEIGRGHAQSIYMLCLNRAVHASVDVPGMRVTKIYDRLHFGTVGAAEKLPRTQLNVGDRLFLPQIQKTVTVTKEKISSEIHNSFNTFYFKNANICGSIYLASRNEGDSVRLLGRGCTKSLKKLFQEAGIPPQERDGIPVLYDEKGVIAVCGFGIAERCAAQGNEEVIKIEIK